MQPAAPRRLPAPFGSGGGSPRENSPTGPRARGSQRSRGRPRTRGSSGNCSSACLSSRRRCRQTLAPPAPAPPLDAQPSDQRSQSPVELNPAQAKSARCPSALNAAPRGGVERPGASSSSCDRRLTIGPIRKPGGHVCTSTARQRSRLRSWLPPRLPTTQERETVR